MAQRLKFFDYVPSDRSTLKKYGGFFYYIQTFSPEKFSRIKRTLDVVLERDAEHF